MYLGIKLLYMYKSLGKPLYYKSALKGHTITVYQGYKSFTSMIGWSWVSPGLTSKLNDRVSLLQYVHCVPCLMFRTSVIECNSTWGQWACSQHKRSSISAQVETATTDVGRRSWRVIVYCTGASSWVDKLGYLKKASVMLELVCKRNHQ